MNINIQYVQMSTSETFSAFITQKLEKIAQKYSWIIAAEVAIKQTNTSDDKSKVCDIKLSLPGPLLFASATQRSFELAFRDAVSEIERQLEKRKDAFKKNHVKQVTT